MGTNQVPDALQNITLCQVPNPNYEITNSLAKKQPTEVQRISVFFWLSTSKQDTVFDEPTTISTKRRPNFGKPR